MRAVVQKVISSSVTVNNITVGKIDKGFNVLVGFSKDDTVRDLQYIKDKIINLRVFEDENQKMNLSLADIHGELLIISQFTLYGDVRKGRRPNFMAALGGEEAEKLYLQFIEMLKEENLKVETGEFGSHMQVHICNDGPVTILLDSTRNF